MTVDFALRLASAAAQVLLGGGGAVLIGKDTRVSGYMFEAALEAGFVAAGADVLMTGPLPTPPWLIMTRQMKCRLGVVISASHNGYEDNGIKFFDGEGGKLSDELEERSKRSSTARRDALLARDRTRARVDSALFHYQDLCNRMLGWARICRV
jgi:phosphoglucosamine mutase